MTAPLGATGSRENLESDLPFGLGHFMTNDAAYSSTRSGAKDSAADHIASYTADDSAGGRSFFLIGHTGTATQAQGSQ